MVDAVAKGVTIQVVIPPWLNDWLREHCDQAGIPVSTFVRMKLIEIRRADAA